MQTDVKTGAMTYPMGRLPPEVMAYIAAQLPASDVLNLACTNGAIHDAIGNALIECRRGVDTVCHISDVGRRAQYGSLMHALDAVAMSIHCTVSARRPEFLCEMARAFAIAFTHSIVTPSTVASVPIHLASTRIPVANAILEQGDMPWHVYLDHEMQHARAEYKESGTADSLGYLYQASAFMLVLAHAQPAFGDRYLTPLLFDVEKLPKKQWPVILGIVLQDNAMTDGLRKMIAVLAQSYDATFPRPSTVLLTEMVRALLGAEAQSNVRAHCQRSFDLVDAPLRTALLSVMSSMIQYKMRVHVFSLESTPCVHDRFGDVLARWASDDPDIYLMFHDLALSHVHAKASSSSVRTGDDSDAEYEVAWASTFLGLSREETLALDGKRGLIPFWECYFAASDPKADEKTIEAVWRLIPTVPWQLTPILLKVFDERLIIGMSISQPPRFEQRVKQCIQWEARMSADAREQGIRQIGLRALALSLKWQARRNWLQGRPDIAPVVSDAGMALLEEVPAEDRQVVMALLKRMADEFERWRREGPNPV